MKRITIYCFVLLLLMAGCTEVLDVAPVSTITGSGFWKSSEDADAYIIGVYDKLRDVTNTEYYGEDRGDTFKEGHIGPVSSAWAHVLRADNAPNWASFYNLIFHENTLIKKTEELEFSDQNKKNQILAEAYTLRAFSYFYIAKIWGDVPLILEPAENADVELVARTPVSQVFDQINSDITKALSLYPTNGYVNKNKMSKPATYALQADVKMWSAKVLGGGSSDFNDALNAISQVEASGVSLLPNYRDVILTTNKKNDEIIFSIFFEKDEQASQFGIRLSTRGDNFTYLDNYDEMNLTDANKARAVYAPSDKLQAFFKENPGDTREAVAIIHGVYTDPGTGVLDTIITVFNKFRGTRYSDDRYYDDDFPVYRYADIILLKAEALAALDRTGEAITELNKTRNRANIGDYTGPADKQSVELEILNERWRELVVENKRWNDLVRFHHGGTINIYDEVPNLQEKDGYPLYFPVRQSILDNNSLIIQTPGYE